MVSLLRRFQQPLMIIVTILVIIAFVWLFNSTNPQFDQMGANEVGQIYGRNVRQVDFVRAARKFDIARDLQEVELLQSLAGSFTTMDQATENFVWNTMILRHEADALGIVPSEQDVEEFVKGMPAFQSNGAYDPTRFVQFSANALAPRGSTEEQLFEIVADAIRVERIKEVLGATAPTSPSEVRAVYELRNQKTDVSVIRLKLADFLAAVQLTEDDLKKAYEERKASLTTDEKRKVKYAGFVLTEEEQKLTGRERVAAMEKLADKAQEFAIQMTEPGAKFDEVAKKLEVTTAITPEFTALEAPKELGSAPEIARAAFQLTKEQPHSDALSSQNGYYVLELAEILEKRPLTFEEARPKLEEQLKSERAQEAITLKGTEIRQKIAAAMKAGKSFADAATEAGMAAEKFPTFSLAQPNFEQPDANEVISRSADLKVGEISEFAQTAAGGVIIHLDNRLPIDEAEFEKEKGVIAEQLERNRRESLFREWLDSRRDAANISYARG
ncbi:MAG: SurA N-terminal domain-containing protein [Chthoniobacteraceae bacterium]